MSYRLQLSTDTCWITVVKTNVLFLLPATTGFSINVKEGAFPSIEWRNSYVKMGKRKKVFMNIPISNTLSPWSPQSEMLFSGFRSCEQAYVKKDQLTLTQLASVGDSVTPVRTWQADIYFCYKCAERKVVSYGISSNSAEYVFYLLFRAYNLPVKQIFKILPLKNKWLQLSNVIFINNLIFYYGCEISPIPHWQICMTHDHFLLQVFLKEFVCACMCMCACMCVYVCVCVCF